LARAKPGPAVLPGFQTCLFSQTHFLLFKKKKIFFFSFIV